MIASKLLYKFVSPKVFLKIRQKYFLYRKKMHRPLSLLQMKDMLTNKMHLKHGDVVFIHSSMDYLNIDFSANKLLNMLISYNFV